jgi:hypothetical protein
VELGHWLINKRGPEVVLGVPEVSWDDPERGSTDAQRALVSAGDTVVIIGPAPVDDHDPRMEHG